ncbi:Protein of unknown function [Austwickia chelonae]|uniref:DUF1003 domain-containing protein n=1 Tax=Austwickia chelonae NBRC 105200 TaxID=1184607 RepID=K6VNE5_9MICO|nr:DUF1003 domain-containing protein [Austwickia chelonae]GAB78249.1 hypothetical protein AUCHE_08_04950 [Austwickia chelonae NBRC 105200]SEV99616.1 Protein of unknown function [Austwickia chelonae]
MTETRRDPYRLDQPREVGSRSFPWPRLSLDSDRFGVFAEKFARFMGTARFLVWMTIFVIAWVTFNLVGIFGLQFDPYPFILLNLFFSTQASYAAPLILLAQNRQDDRDRVALEQDRARDERNLADTEYLTREVAALRIAMREIVTRDYLRSELRDLLEELKEQPPTTRPEPVPPPAPAVPRRTRQMKSSTREKQRRKALSATRPTEHDPMADQARALLAGERRAGQEDTPDGR